MKQKLAYLLAGLGLAFILYEVYYWHTVLVWVDNIRINEMIQQAAKQQQAPPKAP